MADESEEKKEGVNPSTTEETEEVAGDSEAVPQDVGADTDVPGDGLADTSAAAGDAPARRGPRLTRRRFFGLIAGGMLAGGIWRTSVVDVPPGLATLKLSREARELILKCWEGLDPAKVVDTHVHVMGLGIGGTGCFVHPEALSFKSPVRWVKTRFYKGAAGLHDDARADPLFVQRLVDLCTHQNPQGRSLIMAFDKHHDAKGEPDLDHTEFFTPNTYVAALAKKHPDLFLFCGSVHPYRPDALDELRRVRDLGAVAIKWLPNAMNIDPADERCDPYYALLRELKLTLITHGGEEQAVHSPDAQELGNPLRIRRALDAGVKVVVAHCASLGSNDDTDAEPGPDGKLPRVSSYKLFRRMMTEKKYAGLLYGDTSAMTQFNRCEDPLSETLVATDLAGRLVNGSDYPLPAIDPLIRTGLLEGLGYITARERELINQVFNYNPLTFDFVLKRCLRFKKDGVEHRLPDSTFETTHLFALG